MGLITRRRILIRRIVVLGVVALSLAFLAACAPLGSSIPTGTSGQTPTKAPTKSLTKSDNGQGGVGLEVTWATKEYFATRGQAAKAGAYDLDKDLVFLVTFETHSGDVTNYDLLKLAKLRDDAGNTRQPKVWDPISNDAHHRSGMLIFPRSSDKGVMPGDSAKYLELSIGDIAGASERLFRWELAS